MLSLPLEKILESDVLVVDESTPLLDVFSLMCGGAESGSLWLREDVGPMATLVYHYVLVHRSGGKGTTTITNGSPAIAPYGIFTLHDFLHLWAYPPGDPPQNPEQLTQTAVGAVSRFPLCTLAASQYRNIFHVVDYFRQYAIHHLPVVDEQQQLQGVITAKTVQAQLQGSHLANCYRAADILHGPVMTAQTQATPLELSQLMVRHGETCVVIMAADDSDSRPQALGLVTPADLLRSGIWHGDRPPLTAQEIMQPISQLTPQTSLWQMDRFQGKSGGCGVVVGENQTLEGVIRPQDFLKILTPEKLFQAIAGLQSRVEQLERENLRHPLPTLRHGPGDRLDAQGILDNLPHLLHIYDLDRESNCYVNQQFSQTLGYLPDDLQSMGSQFLSQLVHPEDLAKVSQYYQSFQNHPPQEVQEIEYRMRDRWGHWHWFSSRDLRFHGEGAPETCRVLGSITDFTAEKQVNRKLKLFEQAIAASSNGIIIADATKKHLPIIYVNDAFSRITGYLPEEAWGQHWRFIHDYGEDHQELAKLRDAFIQEKNCVVVIRNFRKNGTLFWNEFTVAPIHEKGQLTHFLGIINDITDRRNTELKLRNSLKEKELLLKEIHHRVKNNLFVVSNLLDFQTDYTDDPNVIKILKESQNRIYSMALIHEKLYQSTNLRKINFNKYLESLLENLFESYNSSASDRISLEYYLDPVDLNIETANSCGLIVNELISNALKHAFVDRERGVISVRLTQYINGVVNLIIKDNGVGFPDNLQLETMESLGMELILTLTKQIKGELELIRQEGTKFLLTFSERNYRSRW